MFQTVYGNKKLNISLYKSHLQFFLSLFIKERGVFIEITKCYNRVDTKFDYVRMFLNKPNPNGLLFTACEYLCNNCENV